VIVTDNETDELASIVLPDTRLEQIADGMLFGEGPLWDSKAGALLWVDILGDTIWRWTPGVGREVVRRPSGKTNGLTFDLQGRLVSAGWGSRNVWRQEPDGRVVELVTHYQGRRINTPNDIVVHSSGAIYWTDSSGALFIPGMAVGDVQRYIPTHPVFRLAPDDSTLTLFTDDVAYPNGLAFSPDESVLYVADTWGANIQAFPVDADGQRTGPGRVFYQLIGNEPGIADGMKVDVTGNVYVTGPLGVHVISPQGRLLGRLKIPGHTTNMAWGDADWRSLYVTTYTSVYRIRLGIAGLPVPTQGATS
jgi:gluconolactonase